MLMEKKGELVSNHFVEIVVGIAVVVVLILLATSFFGEYKEEREVCDGYIEWLEREIGVADEGGVGRISVYDFWGETEVVSGDSNFLDEDHIDNSFKMGYSIAYFGDLGGFGSGEDSFSHNKNGENVICACFFEDDVNLCPSCLKLDVPVSFDGSSGTFVIREGASFEIRKTGGSYVFSRK